MMELNHCIIIILWIRIDDNGIKTDNNIKFDIHVNGIKSNVKKFRIVVIDDGWKSC